MTEQELEDMIFFLAQTDASLTTDRFKGSLEQTDIFKGLAFFLASQSLLAAQLYGDTGKNLIQIEGFDNIIISTIQQVLANQRFLTKSCQHNHWHRSIAAANFLQHFITVLPRQHDVQKNQINLLPLKQRNALRPRIGRINRVFLLKKFF